MSINSVAIAGRLVRDVDFRQTQIGTGYATFCIAVKRNYKTDETDFIDCVAWGKTAEFVSKWFHKGDAIGITGSIQSRTWKDRSGTNRKSVEIAVNNASFVGEAKRSNNVSPPPEPYVEEMERELPF